MTSNKEVLQEHEKERNESISTVKNRADINMGRKRIITASVKHWKNLAPNGGNHGEYGPWENIIAKLTLSEVDKSILSKGKPNEKKK